MSRTSINSGDHPTHGFLNAWGLMDPNAEQELDSFAFLASALCDVPIAFLELRNSAGERYVAAVGVSRDAIPEDAAIWGAAHGGGPLWEEEDLRASPAFASTPIAVNTTIAATFAAAVGLAPGKGIHGVIGVLDRHPRTLTNRQREGLLALRSHLVRYLQRDASLSEWMASEVERSEALRDGHEHFRFLHTLGEKTRTVSNPESIMDLTAGILGHHLKASRCAYAEVEADTNKFTILSDYTDGCDSTAGAYLLENFGSQAAEVLRQGGTLVVRDVDTELTPADGGAMFNAIGIKAIICCGLVKAGALRAMMAVHHVTPRDWSDSEIQLVQEVVERCWETIERARAETLARRTERQFQDLFEYAPDALVMIDARLQITMVNRRAELMFGMGRETLLDRDLHVLMPRALPLVQRVLREGPDAAGRSVPGIAEDAAIKGVRKDGAEFPIEIAVSPLSIDAERWVALAVRDVTDRDEARNASLRAQRLESIGTLAGGVAHDLNNALAPVPMAIESVRESEEPSEEMLDTIESAVARAAAMVRQLLTFARGVEGERQLLNVAELVEEVSAIIRGSFPKNIELRLSAAPDLHPIVGDMTQLHQVLVNLCVNARDAMTSGGVLTIEVENLNPNDPPSGANGLDLEEGYVVVRVRDTGVGIPDAILERIFEPFYSTKGSEQGTGLGLSTAIGIVNSHGGELKVSSTPGTGTEFTLLLKATREGIPEVKSSETLHARPDGRGRTILVVEDEEAIRKLAVHVLEMFNFNVLSASDGEEGLRLFESAPESISIVMSDLNMPKRDGLSLTREILERAPDTMIVIMSGLLDDDEATALRDLGVDTLLRKPFSVRSLTDALLTLLDE